LPPNEALPESDICVFDLRGDSYAISYIYKSVFFASYSFDGVNFIEDSLNISHAATTSTTDYYITSKINQSDLYGPDSLYLMTVKQTEIAPLVINYYIESIAWTGTGPEEKFEILVGKITDYSRHP